MTSRHRQSAIVAALVGSLALGCEREAAAPDTFSYSIFVEYAGGAVTALEVGGTRHEPDRVQRDGASFEVSVPADTILADTPPSVVVATTCGDTKLPATLSFGSAKAKGAAAEKKERADSGKLGGDVIARATFEAPEAADVFLDLDGEAAEVAIGATKLEATAKKQRVHLGPCETAKDVKVGGEVVGKLAVAKRAAAPDDPGVAVIDVAGGHCYEQKVHVYVDKTVDPRAMAKSPPKRLEGGRVYAVDFDDFLTPPPEKLSSEWGLETRTELRRCP